MRFERDGFSVEAARKKKRKLPDWYLDEPPQPTGCEPFYRAFRDLATCRSGGDGPIPWTACRLYIRDNGIARDVGRVLWDVVRQLDTAERRWQVENMKADEGGG